MAIPNIYQSIEDVVKSSLPDQRIIWQEIRLITGENAAVRPIFYFGAIAGTRFNTYAATSLYFAYNLLLGTNSYAAQNTSTSVNLYDRTNALYMMLGNESALWQATAAAVYYTHNIIQVNNLLFARIVPGAYTYMNFAGYEIVY